MNQAESSGEPEWNCLPHDPIGFFGLPTSFDRKSLKRKYNQFIRKYKPERAPAEFQKIRAAFEMLDGRLRYGTPTASLASDGPTFKWDLADSDQRTLREAAEASLSVEEKKKARARDPKQAPIHERLENESAALIYRDLEKKKGKTPYDYFAMALIADVVKDDELLFFKIVLTGLSKHPNEHGLFNLLHEYLQQDIEAEHLSRVLRTVSKVIRNQRFYFLTEKLWDKLLRETNFSIWRKTLEACEANLQDYRIEGKLAFYIHVLPKAMWRADETWIRKTFAFLEENNSEIPHTLEVDYELLYQLRDYQDSLQHHGIFNSEEIHQTIIDYFELGEREGDEAVIALQSRYSNNAAELLGVYGPETPYNDQQIVIWEYINDEVCQRSDLFSRVSPRKLRERIYDLLDDLNKNEFASFGLKDELLYRLINWGPYIAVAVTPFILLGAWMSSTIFLVSLVLALLGVVAVFCLYKPGDRYEKYMEKKMKRRYFSSWRGRFVHLFEATQVPHGELTHALIDVIQNHQESLGFASWVCRYLPADAGLHLYASACRYKR